MDVLQSISAIIITAVELSTSAMRIMLKLELIAWAVQVLSAIQEVNAKLQFLIVLLR